MKLRNPAAADPMRRRARKIFDNERKHLDRDHPDYGRPRDPAIPHQLPTTTPTHYS